MLSFALYKLVGAITPLRAEEQDEWTGLDQSEAGERAYISGDMDASSSAATEHAAPTEEVIDDLPVEPDGGLRRDHAGVPPVDGR